MLRHIQKYILLRVSSQYFTGLRRIYIHPDELFLENETSYTPILTKERAICTYTKKNVSVLSCSEHACSGW